MIPISELTIKPLTAEMDLTSFSCFDKDLNDFLKDDALRDQEFLYSTTKIIEYQNHIVGFFTLVGDTINPNLLEKSIGKKYDYSKMPAVKIARLATDKQYERQGIGRAMMTPIFRIIIDTTHNIGYRIITVDAKSDAVGFYQKFAFSPALSKRKNETVPMYLDIKPLYDAHKHGQKEKKQ